MPQPDTAAPRIAPLAPPYSPELDALLQRMTPPGAPSVLALFRVLAHNPELASRSTAWGGYLLGRKASLPLRDREIVIDRVCARCGAQYDWACTSPPSAKRPVSRPPRPAPSRAVASPFQ